MNNGILEVGTNGGPISDWGGSATTTTATLTNNSLATFRSGLRMGVFGGGGTTNATISGGARLVSHDSLVTGGEAASNVTLNVTGGRVDSDGLITLQRGTTTTVSSAGLMEGQDITLGSSGGTTITTVTGVDSLLKARGALTAGRSSIETNVGQSIVNNALVEAIFGSQIRSDLTNAGTLNLFGSTITRGLTLQSGSVMNVEEAAVGSLTQQAGADIRFGLLSASDFGKLTVTGAANLAGNFVVTLDSNFTPTAGMTFPIFTASSIVGEPNFDFSAATLPSGLGWAVDFQPTSLGLAVIPVFVLHGDYNQDDVVDAEDYTVWRDALGSSVTLPNDSTPGAVTQADYVVWKNNFGQSGNMNLLAATASVPEPTSMVLLLALFASCGIATRSTVRCPNT